MKEGISTHASLECDFDVYCAYPLRVAKDVITAIDAVHSGEGGSSTERALVSGA